MAKYLANEPMTSKEREKLEKYKQEIEERRRKELENPDPNAEF